ncbi:Kiwa anti-phage protein KwaB-like domain-containing protein [Marinococcus sp. PL1-022]|uniref:Kiwa anti-phage protein KwaB-like domain-containing protein n=1 Tax=Marinococcus sp. PL1-022 TaxID=3095363 RepID=UPI0029C5B9A6|nr:Kiwa anti-phage protein KwaB-like domain-containing protein [Marinococcus sp. PL1-022]MDX6154323.1 DUF4868 domain-containing protein [Marinococcus sp. PL1-022]
MSEILSNLWGIFNEADNNYEINGYSIFLLTNEEENYTLYKMNVSTNEDLKRIAEENAFKIKDAQLHSHFESPSPDRVNVIAYLEEKNVPIYKNIKQKIKDDNFSILTKKKYEELESSIKGYVIKINVNDSEKYDFDVYFFSKLNKSNYYKAKSHTYIFGNGKDDYLQKTNTPLLELEEKNCAIGWGNDILIIHNYFFEQLFKYTQHIDANANNALENLSNRNWITNFNIVENKCQNNSNLKRKLYSIWTTGKLENFSFEVFAQMKKEVGDKVFFNLDEKNNQITLDVSKANEFKAVDQIIRIVNGETAKTLVDSKYIFADKKVDISSK